MIRPKVGDIFQIPLPKSRFAYGKVFVMPRLASMRWSSILPKSCQSPHLSLSWWGCMMTFLNQEWGQSSGMSLLNRRKPNGLHLVAFKMQSQVAIRSITKVNCDPPQKRNAEGWKLRRYGTLITSLQELWAAESMNLEWFPATVRARRLQEIRLRGDAY